MAGRRSTWPCNSWRGIPRRSCRRWPRRSASRHRLQDPACVKVVFDSRGRALYFSRSPIPHARRLGRCAADRGPGEFLSAHRAVRLPPRVPAATGRDAALEPGTRRELGATPSLVRGLHHPGRRDRPAHDRDRHAGGLPGLCQPVVQQSGGMNGHGLPHKCQRKRIDAPAARGGRGREWVEGRRLAGQTDSPA